jgi:DNA-directed DNA polymerase III PolC
MPAFLDNLSLAMSAYAELHCLSNFTFLRGASHPKELVQRACDEGYEAIALTDECSVAGVVRALVEVRALKTQNRHIRFIVGSEFRLTCGLRFVALAPNRKGYGRLCRFITRGRRNAEKGSYSLDRMDVQALLSDCLILWLPGAQPDASQAQWLSQRFPGNVWIAVELLCEGRDRERLAELQALSREVGLPLVAAGDVHMHVRARRKLQDVLTAIRHTVPIAEAGWRLYPNGERHLRTRERLARLYPPELLAETLLVARRCEFSLEELQYEYPHELVPSGQTPTTYLRQLVEEGAREKWPEGMSEKTRRTIENELSIIATLKYEPFFLTVQDIVRYARGEGILCQGRGSAANSVVCFCLGVTSIDPERSDACLLVERFISVERNEPPDIDIDFEHEQRERVIQYVYRKYGRERSALAATVIMYRPRSALRDIGKAFGLDPLQVARLAKTIQWWDGNAVDEERVREAGIDPSSPVLLQVMDLAQQIMEFPRHLSQHVGGIVISQSRLDELVPIENATMEKRTVVQWDKDDLNELRLLKVDLLGLGMLSALRRAFGLVNDYWDGTGKYKKRFTLGTLPPEDPHVYDMMGKADTVGVFQIESRAQMSMLPRLQPRSYYDLVIEVAIVRPGPIQGDMVHPYLRRRAGEEKVTYPNEKVKNVLARTLGVPIFQEQVMQLAMVAAGFTGGEADSLRRAMAAWKKRGGLEPFKDKLINGMLERNYERDFAERIFKQMLGFGEYGFPECVVGETRVIDADTGRWVTIDEVKSGRAHLDNTFACDSDMRLRKRKVLAVVASGTKPVWRLRTALGHSIVATAEHPFMTMDGWRQLGTLKAGDRIAAARTLPMHARRRWPRHQVLVLADLIAEGNVCHPSTFYFYTTAAWHCEAFVKAVEQFPNTRAVVERHKNCFSVRVRRIDRAEPPGAVTWARALGLWGCKAREKHVPAEVFELCDANIALLLARLWEGDGGFSMRGHASYDTASQRLASEVQHLLLRLGIVARIYRRTRLWKGRILEHYTVTVTGDEPLGRFWRLVGRRFMCPERRHSSKTLAACRKGRMSRDVIPASVRMLIRRERDALGLGWREIGRASGLGMREIQARSAGCKGGFRRFVIDRLATVLRSPDLARLANSDIYWDEVVSIEKLGPQPTYDLQIEGDHNFLANNLVVHNSHAASFALLVYDSAWLKCYEPAAFTCALLNSLPMGFYAPAQLVRDAREHGVEVQPVRVESSYLESTLEPRESNEGGTRAAPALRLGMKLVKSLSAMGAQRIETARALRPFESVQDLAERAALDRADLEALAAAGALASLSGNRHLAFWEVAGTERSLPLAPRSTRTSGDEEGRPLLTAPTDWQTVVADYSATGLTLGAHPLLLLRDRLARAHFLRSADLRDTRHGTLVRVAGIVLMRQHPGSAKGVTFMTIEDETGSVNIIVWERISQQQRRPMLESRLLEVQGELQRQHGVTHVIAQRLIDRSGMIGELLARSRDFH